MHNTNLQDQRAFAKGWSQGYCAVADPEYSRSPTESPI